MVWPVQEGALPDAERQILNRIPSDAVLILDDAATGKLRVYHTFPDIQGKAALLLCALVPRSITAQGREAVAVALVSIVIMGLIAYLVFRAFLQRTVAHPIVDLTRHATRIGESNELSLRIPFHRSDEIGTLAKAFNGMLERLEQHSQERERLSKELERLSQQDALTGLANRRAFDAALEREWRRALRSEEFLSVIMIDVDCFKAYNDNYGHPSGDSALREVAAVLSATLRRPGDLAARYGGEEFVLILPATDHGGARHLADAIRGAVEALTIPHSVSPVGPSLTVSLGVATAAPHREGSAKTLIEHADQALYRAKQSGRNRVEQAPAM